MKKSIIFLVIALILITTASAETIFKTNTKADIKVPCYDGDAFCPSTAECNLTVLYPNGTEILNNQVMTYSTSFFNYTLNENQTNEIGDYQANVLCISGTDSGIYTFTFYVNPNSRRPDTGVLSSIIFVVSIILILGMLFMHIYNIAKLTILNVTIKDVAISLSFYFGILMMYWANMEYTNVIFLINYLEIFYKIAWIGLGLVPLIGLVISFFYKSTKKKNVPEVNELTGWRIRRNG